MIGVNLLQRVAAWFARASRTNVHTVVAVSTVEATHTFSESVAHVLLGNPNSGPVYYRLDDTAVTTGNGMLLPAGAVLQLAPMPGAVLRLIGGSAGMSVTVDEVTS